MRAVNLLPRELPRQRKKLGVEKQLALVSPLVLAAVLGAGYLVTSSKVSDNRATLRALQDELAALPPSREPPQVDAELTAQHEQRIQALAAALRSRVAWDRILRQISSVLPEDVWLQSLRAQSPQSSAPVASPLTTGSGLAEGTAAPAAASPAPASGEAPLAINGYTYSQEGVARFLSRLAVIPELTQVVLRRSELTTVADRLVVKFTIEASIRGQEAS